MKRNGCIKLLSKTTSFTYPILTEQALRGFLLIISKASHVYSCISNKTEF